ncbi:MAG: hypothetical protein ABSD98_13560 [Candidatus Korobacteraceae bacterium]|jgi:hypothetical protein
MAAKKLLTSSKGAATKLQFSVELEPGDLSAEEIESVGNAITKAILGSAGKKSVIPREKREPYVRIIFCKAIPRKRQ